MKFRISSVSSYFGNRRIQYSYHRSPIGGVWIVTNSIGKGKRGMGGTSELNDLIGAVFPLSLSSSKISIMELGFPLVL